MKQVLESGNRYWEAASSGLQTSKNSKTKYETRPPRVGFAAGPKQNLPPVIGAAGS